MEWFISHAKPRHLLMLTMYLCSMKTIHILVLTVAALFFACGGDSASTGETKFGQDIDTASALTTDQALALLDSSTSASCTVMGNVSEICQAEGCWLKLSLSDGSGLLVMMKEHSFAVPKTINGKSVFVGGIITRDTTSVATLQEYAKEDGKTADEIAAITEPEIKPVVVPTGIIVR